MKNFQSLEKLQPFHLKILHLAFRQNVDTFHLKKIAKTSSTL